MSLLEAFDKGLFEDEREVDECLKLMGNKMFLDILNIVKGSYLMEYSYEECINEVKERIGNRRAAGLYFSDEALSRMANAVIIKHLIAKGDGNFKKMKEFIDYTKIDEPVSDWDEYYYNIARQVARNSKCLSIQIGAVLVRDKTMICSGYCGPPRGVPHCGEERYAVDSKLKTAIGRFIPSEEEIKTTCPRQLLGFKSGEGLEWCVSGHAERNALIQAGREGISTKNTKLYSTRDVPCTPCFVEIINAGVEEVIVTSMDTYDLSGEYLLRTSGVKVRLYNFI